MLDCILAVDNAEEWQAENMKRNPSHYSGERHQCWVPSHHGGLRWFGAKMVADTQTQYAARVYFNTLVPFGDSVRP
jgi:hypothetical protein